MTITKPLPLAIAGILALAAVSASSQAPPAQPAAPKSTRKAHGLHPVSHDFDASDRRLAVVDAKVADCRLCPKVSAGAPPFDARRMLAIPTKSAIDRAPAGIAQLLRELKAIGKTMTPEQLFRIFPGIVVNQSRVLEGTIVIGSRECRCGFAFITAPLPRIRERERDYVAYLKRFKEYSAVDVGHYSFDKDRTWVCVRSDAAISVDWWPDPPLHVTSLEHWVGDRVTVDYYLTCDYAQGMGRDEYFPVSGADGLYGFVVLTLFGYDEEGKFIPAKVGADIVANLDFMADAGRTNAVVNQKSQRR